MRPRAAALLIGLALGLTSCNGRLPQAQMAPFADIGPWTGTQWEHIGPTLGGRLVPSSSNLCEPGAPACMDAVVAEMSRRMRALGCSHLAPFASMYRWVSVEVRRGVDARTYTGPRYVTHLDAVFATYYFHALDAWRSGHRDLVPNAWRMAFSAADRRQVSALGDLLLGMNAHISRDLPYALASVGLQYPNGRDATADVVAINGAIERAQKPMLAEIKARYDPMVGPPPGLPQWLQPRLLPRIMAQWRLEALANARALLNAHSAAERIQIETEIDANASLRALLIWRTTAYTQPPRDTAARDRYCAAHS
jgi:hypothetical protein